MPVPEGLAGMRVDAGLARLLGLSRTAAAALAEDGGVELDGARAGKSDKLTAGAWLEVRLPEAPAPVENTPVEIEGMAILYSDDDIVAVDKPPGRGRARDRRMARADGARRPCRRGVPDQHVGNPRAAGHRAPPRRRHLGRHGGGTLRTRLHRAQAGVQAAHRRKALSRTGAGPSRSVQRDHRRADRPPPRPRLEVRGHRGRSAQHHPLRHAGGAPGRQPARHRTGNRSHPPDPGALRRAAPPVLPAT